MYTITLDGALYARTNQPEQAINWLQGLGASRATAWNMVNQCTIHHIEICNIINGQTVCVRHS